MTEARAGQLKAEQVAGEEKEKGVGVVGEGVEGKGVGEVVVERVEEKEDGQQVNKVQVEGEQGKGVVLVGLVNPLGEQSKFYSFFSLLRPPNACLNY